VRGEWEERGSMNSLFTRGFVSTGVAMLRRGIMASKSVRIATNFILDVQTSIGRGAVQRGPVTGAGWGRKEGKEQPGETGQSIPAYSYIPPRCSDPRYEDPPDISSAKRSNKCRRRRYIAQGGRRRSQAPKYGSEGVPRFRFIYVDVCFVVRLLLKNAGRVGGCG
jgi:hypothetical protein